MHCKVKILRSHGARLSAQAIASDLGTDGDLTLAKCAGIYELNLAARDDSQKNPLIPILYDARLVTMHGNGMLFRGFYRAENGAEYVQEWSVMVLST